MNVQSEHKLSLWSLVALVVGSMIGAGIFSLPATFGRATGVMGAIVAWCIAGGGMLMLAFVFQSLAQRKPTLDSGVFAYAQAGFGNYAGFISALGFWAGCCVANVSFFLLVKSTLGSLFPIFGSGDTVSAVIGSSFLLWLYHILILRGVKGAAIINTIATVAKIVPIFIFIGLLIWTFNSDIFSANFWGERILAGIAADLTSLGEYGYTGHAAEVLEAGQVPGLFAQVRSTMLVTVFVFVGIEGASVYSRYARNRKDVGIATVLGFIGVLCLLVLVTLLSYGVMDREQLAALRQPSMAGVLEHAIGSRWGAVFISCGLIVSVLGAYLSWTLLAAEVLFVAAKERSMPSFLTRENRQGVPVAALWLTNITVQAFLVLSLYASYAFTLALELTSALCLVPYLMVGAYGLKLAWTGETYERSDGLRRKDLIVALLATIYACLMLYAGGVKYILLSALIYTPGSTLFFIARRERGERIFSGFFEKTLFVAIFAASLVAVYAILYGYIRI